jgi:broad specificity phosphatase PhoE
MPIPARPFYFLRHGQTDWNVEGRLQGHTDVPLNSTGLQQAQAAAQRLTGKPIHRIISSPLRRALTTAVITADAVNLPLHVDAQLKERTFGSFEGRLTAEVKQQYGVDPHTPISTLLPPDAEQWHQTVTRARSSIGHWLTQYPNETLLFVGHGAFFRALHEALTGERREAANATPYYYTPGAGGIWYLKEI